MTYKIVMERNEAEGKREKQIMQTKSRLRELSDSVKRNNIVFLLQVRCYLSFLVFDFFPLVFSLQKFDCDVSWCGFLWVFLFRILMFLDSVGLSFAKFGKFSVISTLSPLAAHLLSPLFLQF